MTREERYMKDHPECEEFDPGDGFIGCPMDYGYSTKHCSDYHRCGDCWNQPAIGVTVEEDEEDIRSAILSDLAGGVVPWKQDLAKACEGIPAKDLAKALSDIEKCHIKDSGERRQFETGAVRDIQEGKGRCDLLPLDVIDTLLTVVNGKADRVLVNIHTFTISNDVCYLAMSIARFCEPHWKNTSTMLLEVSKHFEEGAKKYSENNWKKGIPTHCYIDSAVRHYLKYLRGDTDEPHDRAFVWNILCCIWTCIHKPELNDYRKAEEDV